MAARAILEPNPFSPLAPIPQSFADSNPPPPQTTHLRPYPYSTVGGKPHIRPRLRHHRPSANSELGCFRYLLVRNASLSSASHSRMPSVAGPVHAHAYISAPLHHGEYALEPPSPPSGATAPTETEDYVFCDPVAIPLAFPRPSCQPRPFLPNDGVRRQPLATSRTIYAYPPYIGNANSSATKSTWSSNGPVRAATPRSRSAHTRATAPTASPSPSYASPSTRNCGHPSCSFTSKP